MLFNIGDIITVKPDYQGFKEAEIIKCDGRIYTLKIPCGIATVLVETIDTNYTLL